MRVEHLAIDGSVVAFEADSDLKTEATATGWAIVPSLMLAHPFSILPPGHSALVERSVRAHNQEVTILSLEDYRLKDGTLRVAEIRMPTATGVARDLTVGAWEGQTGCLSTSILGHDRNRLIAVFDSLNFSPRRGGLAIDSPVVPQPRSPEVIKEIPNLGVLSVRPSIAGELENVPKARGFATDFGELFRIGKVSNALLLVTRTAVVKITARGRREVRDLLDVAGTLRIEWTPPGTANVVQ